MQTYVLMTKLSPEGMGDPRGRAAAGRAWKEKVTKECPEVKWIAHYALLGQYDFMDVYEAPDAKTAHKISYISRTEGAHSAESWLALPYDEYIDTIA